MSILQWVIIMFKGKYFRDKQSYNFRDKSMFFGSVFNIGCMDNLLECDIKKDFFINKERIYVMIYFIYQ